MEVNKIYHGHVLDILKTFPDGCIDCCITSPPYYGLRDYGLPPVIWDAKEGCQHRWIDKNHIDKRGNAGTGLNGRDPYTGGENRLNYSEGFCSLCSAWRGSLGLEPDYRLYISHLMQVFAEVYRVLKKTGTCFVNIGDSYGGANSRASNGGRAGYGTEREGIFKRGNAKSLIQIPERFSIAMTDAGWIKRNTIIWHKPNVMPSSAKDRFTVDFEYMYFFVKNKKYYFEQQFEQADTPNYRNVGENGTANDTMFNNNPSGHFGNNPEGRNKRTVWTIPTEPCPEAHFAKFPADLIDTPIKAGCPKDGIVLDPFSGMGTVARKAKELDRQYIGIDLSEQYADRSEQILTNINYQHELEFNQRGVK